MDHRVEEKYLISAAAWALIEQKLRPVMQPDPHGSGGCYTVRSIYFDDMYDSCLLDNEAGLTNREKFRIRSYDADDSFLKLELKSKTNGFTKKESCAITKETVQHLLERDPSVCFAPESDFLLKKLGAGMLERRLQSVAVIEYERTAYTYGPGNVRITCDANCGSTTDTAAFWKPYAEMVPILPEGTCVLEIKFDELMPSYIRQLLHPDGLKKLSYSKYYYGRKNHEF